MTTCRKVGLSEKFLTHIDVEDQMKLDLLIPLRDNALWFLLLIKCRSNVLHLLKYGFLPQIITILAVELNCLPHILW